MFEKKLIYASKLINGTGAPILENGALVISNGLIEAVGHINDFPREYSEVLEFPECTILPGLVDAHVHLTLMGTINPWEEMVHDTTVTATIKAITNARRTLEAGVTTIRDMGSIDRVVIEVTEAIEKDLIQGPRVIPSGRVICMTGGQGYPIGVEVDGADEARKAARNEIKRGAKGLKVMATGGVITPNVEPGAPQLTIEELGAVVEEANKAGRRVGAHAHGTEGIKNALLAGVHTIEHCSYLDQEVVELFQKTNAFMVSTLIASMNPMWDIDNPEMPSYLVKKLRTHVDRESQSLKMAIEAKINLAVGTDAGAVLTPHNQMPRQIKLLVEHGMNCSEAIRTGTLNSARALGIDNKIGTLEPGKAADILVVEGNPIERIEDLEHVIAVIKGGKIVMNRLMEPGLINREVAEWQM